MLNVTNSLIRSIIKNTVFHDYINVSPVTPTGNDIPITNDFARQIITNTLFVSYVGSPDEALLAGNDPPIENGFARSCLKNVIVSGAI